MDGKKDVFYMQKALRQAQIALKKNEVPVGAVIVNKDGQVIGRGYNKVEKLKCQTGHAEIIAIKKACKKLKDWRLEDCWIYVTLEPCLMCLGLIKLSRIKGLVFGSCSNEFGFGYKNIKVCNFYKKNLIIKQGLKEVESIKLLKNFFKKLRLNRKVKGEAEKTVLRKGRKEIVTKKS
ncbi:nucleoside deaminase [Candidatus Babeliales bacterium]|nr:nucleoside deaminase [Candidatus Babeliales bacterium]MCF7899479.1 nucleoside deaminase [Candidatus Babeliales bacterium]